MEFLDAQRSKIMLVVSKVICRRRITCSSQNQHVPAHQDNFGYDNDGNDTTQGELHSLDSSVHDNCEGESDSKSNRMRSMALFILKLRELKSLTQSTIDTLVVDVKEQIDAAIEEHSAATSTLLNKAGIV